MHKNNFDFLRLLFAAFVVVHHCYPISGISEQDPLFYFSHGSLSYSYLGVRGFFIISGYLIFQSLFRSKNILDYLVKRILRIYPALLVVLIISMLACSFVFDGSISSYFSQKSTLTYVPVNLSLIKLQNSITGVFEDNPLKSAINGSLWTIIYEFSMYLFLIPFLFLRRFSSSQKTIIISAVVAILFFGRITLVAYKDVHIGALAFGQWVQFALLFMSGALLSEMKIETYKYRYALLVVCALLFFLMMPFKYYEYVQYFILPPIVIIIGAEAFRGISDIGKKFGDVSYGVYIYGFPIQQFLMHYFSFSVLELLLWSLPLSILFGWLSWHHIEKHALAKKKIVFEKINKIFS